MTDEQQPRSFSDALRNKAGQDGPDLALAFGQYELSLSRRLDQLQLSLGERIMSARSYGQVATAASAITLLAVAYLVQSTFTLAGQVGGIQEQIRGIDEDIGSMEQNLNSRIDGLVNSIDTIDNRTREMADRAALDDIEPQSGEPLSPGNTSTDMLLVEEQTPQGAVSFSIVAGARAASLVSAIRSFQQHAEDASSAAPVTAALDELLTSRGIAIESPQDLAELPSLSFLDFGGSGDYGAITSSGIRGNFFGEPSDWMTRVENRSAGITAFQLSVPNQDSFESASARAEKAATLYDSADDFVVIVDVSDGFMKIKWFLALPYG